MSTAPMRQSSKKLNGNSGKPFSLVSDPTPKKTQQITINLGDEERIQYIKRIRNRPSQTPSSNHQGRDLILPYLDRLYRQITNWHAKVIDGSKTLPNIRHRMDASLDYLKKSAARLNSGIASVTSLNTNNEAKISKASTSDEFESFIEQSDMDSEPALIRLEKNMLNLRRFVGESFASLASRLAAGADVLSDLEKTHQVQNERLAHELGQFEILRNEVHDLREVVEDRMASVLSRLEAAEELNKNHRFYLKHSELVSNRLFQALEENKNVGALSPQVLDQRMSHFEAVLAEKTKHWRLYENIFYGLVIVMLLINTGLLIWSYGGG